MADFILQSIKGAAGHPFYCDKWDLGEVGHFQAKLYSAADNREVEAAATPRTIIEF